MLKIDEDPDSDFRVQVSLPVLQFETDMIWARMSHIYASSGVKGLCIHIKELLSISTEA